MFQIGNKLISLDILEKRFVCDLGSCKGSCCVHGDAGAPLTDEEAKTLELEYKKFKDFLSPQGRKSIKISGNWVLDWETEKVTTLINGKECAYAIIEKGILRCGIEKAWKEGKTTFRKPISCHLYPIRISNVGANIALNYHQWSVCDPARILGNQIGIPVYVFLKDAIIRAFGIDFYQELEKVAEKFQTK